MNWLYYAINRIAHIFHTTEAWFVALTHVPDCVSFLETTDLLTSEAVNRLRFVFGHDNKTYNLSVPVHLDKTPRLQVCSATLNEKEDITSHIQALAGPFNNFFMQPLLVEDLVPEFQHEKFELLEIIESDLRYHKYESLKDRVMFHYGHEWPAYNSSERNIVLKKLAFLDLA